LSNTEMLCDMVLSLPMHSELLKEQLAYIIETVLDFYKK
jgi:dTDP-4-amino-4,6-dideoxygalactose transaminase